MFTAHLRNRGKSQRISRSECICRIFENTFDISKGFFGLTATTGGLADNHDVLGMNAYKLDAMDQEGPTPELHFSKQAPEALPAHETVGDPNYDPESALRSLISTEKKISKQEVNDVKHYGTVNNGEHSKCFVSMYCIVVCSLCLFFFDCIVVGLACVVICVSGC